MTTELYRHYDATGALLYVGVSRCSHCRFADGHRVQSGWADEVATITIQRRFGPRSGGGGK
jgi:hypothetical protein